MKPAVLVTLIVSIALCLIGKVPISEPRTAPLHDTPHWVDAHQTTPGASLAAASVAPTYVDTIFALRTALQEHAHHIVINDTIDGGAVPTTIDIRDPDDSGTVIEGATPATALINVQIRIIADSVAIHDITVRNLTIHGRVADLEALSGAQTTPGGVGTNYEAVSVRGAHNITIDHVTAYDTTDDLMSVSRGADQVQISNCDLFFTSTFANIPSSIKWDWGYGSQALSEERLGIIVGSQPSDSYLRTGLLHVNLSNNHIGPLIRGRPLLRGYVNVSGNTFDNTAPGSNQYAAIEVGSGGFVIVDSNTFDHSNNPIVVHLNNEHDDYRLYERNNTFIDTTGRIDPGQGAPPRYDHHVRVRRDGSSLRARTVDSRLRAKTNDDLGCNNDFELLAESCAH